MKPSDFILNSDYLSIAQVGSKTLDVSIGAGSLAIDSYSEQNIDLNVQSIAGAIDKIMISKDGGSFRLGSMMTFYPNNDVRGDINIYRESAGKIRAKITLQNQSSSTTSYPAMSFKIKVSSFKPPNVF